METGGCVSRGVGRCVCGHHAAVVLVTRDPPGAVGVAAHEGSGTLRVAVAVALSLAAKSLDPVAAAIIISIRLPCGVLPGVASLC